MIFESQPTNFAESSKEKNSEKYYQEALSIAQRLSRRWQELIEKAKKNPYLLSGKLAEIYEMNRPPRSGIQVYFESKIDEIKKAAGGDENSESRMMYRLKEELEYIEKQVEEIIG